MLIFLYYSKTCLKRSLKTDKTKVLKTIGSLMKVESIAECSLGVFCNTFDLHKAIIGLETNFCLLFEWQLKTGFTVYMKYYDSLTLYLIKRLLLTLL